MNDKVVRIGSASGAWGDSTVAVPQLVRQGRVHYLVFDYLAELTMTILASAKAKNPDLGYAVDFVDTIKTMLPEIMVGGIRIISNAGGLNPRGCAAALAAAATELGLAPKIAVVVGDDVMGLADDLRNSGVREMQSGAPLPVKLLSANAYLGALPIRRALDEGATIVVTGRCVDCAVTLGALMHEFDWSADDYDRLAAGSLAGHIIECGCQATGGLHTDWRAVPGWEKIGYPIIEARADGSFIVTKPDGTGGLVSPPVIAEQMLYEIGDPARYILPDVVCDFTDVSLRALGADRVLVSGARGLPPTESYKVCATYSAGYKCVMTMTVIGFEAAAMARRMGEAILARSRGLLAARNFGDYERTHIEIVGANACYGPHAIDGDAREVVLRIAVTHADRRALDVFASETGAAGMSWAPGTTGISGRPKPQPMFGLFSFLLPKSRIVPVVVIDDREIAVTVPPGAPLPPAGAHPATAAAPTEAKMVDVPLIKLAYGRSGDKGTTANIAVIARKPELFPHLLREVTPERVAAHLAHLVKGRVTRYAVPGIGALNFLCEDALDGGVAASLRNDPWGKGMAQILLSMPVKAPSELL